MVNYSGEEIIQGYITFFLISPNFCPCCTYIYSMELKSKINIRITDDQLKRLMIAVLKEKITLSELVRNILHQYNEANRGQQK